MAASLLLVLLLAWTTGAILRFASYYGDHMVLQKKPSQAVIWGYADPGTTVMLIVSQGHNLMEKMAETEGSNGIWKVILKPMAPGGPFTIMIRQYDKEEVANATLKDVYFGDVWFCSGQSNMEMTVSQVFNASNELAEASHYPLVRVFGAALVQSEVELQDLASIILPWSIPTAKNLGHGDFSYFSAVCWLFGRYLFEKLKYPIGLIDSSWGGTPVEAWSSKKALQECGISGYAEKATSSYLDAGPKELSVLWNAMVHPFLNMTLYGVIWYQGESNTLLNTDLYNCTFPTLIEDWRKAFHEGSSWQTQRYFPFGFVQLSTNHLVEENDHFPRIRWHQTADYGYVPNKKMPHTFMAVAIDLGDESSPYGSIHPRDKQTVAYRLLLGALAVAYGDKTMVFQGPYPEKVQVDIAHESLNVTFEDHILVRHSDNKTFEVCCSEQALCKWSAVSITSSSSRSVILHNTKCPNNMIGLRYAWTESPCDYKLCPIYNVQGLPAPPFITFSHSNPGWTVS
ncbi:sialate O-acetylesterase [Rhineura floridana]|uniref:sialate O-acetylesterase n=1 Tax=Rhineura floridana TaxID=261503 RepID=UPI002AC8929F|nr:sialate O-acetylesterase [Rhineura floridana]XP_061448898.1 sialate O-acetylesterase [Rhineura floridana]